MADLFEQKSEDWDTRDIIQKLSSAVGSTILEHIPLHQSMKVLDFGAGTGLISSQIAPFVEKIVAVDISRAMLDKLATKPELQGKVEILCQDITQKPINGRFDLIMSAMAMHHVENTSALINTFFDHLNPGAMVALADLDKEDGNFHPEDAEGVYHHGFKREELGRLLEKQGFRDIQFFTAHTIQKEDGAYPVFLLTAKK